MLEIREYTCRIVRIIDGDTIVVDIDLGYGLWQRDQPLRLRGIDAAETNDPDPRLRALAKYQREWVALKLEVGKVYRYKSSAASTVAAPAPNPNQKNAFI